MARQSRQVCGSGVYHLMVRGVNRSEIFIDDNDRCHYLNTLAKIKMEESIIILGYCLMPNHVHLLSKDDNQNISKFMQRLNVSYSRYFNTRHQRVGHLFQNRFRSEAIEDDAYIMTVLSYIHLNPTKAGMTHQPDSYRWSSCQVYYGDADFLPGLTDTEFILAMYSDKLEMARADVRKAAEVKCDGYSWDIDEERMTDAQASQAILEMMGRERVTSWTDLSRADRNAALQQIKGIRGLSIRQICRLTGLAFNVVKRA